MGRDYDKRRRSRRMYDEYFNIFCNDILAKDHTIRFVAVADRQGHLITSAYRKNLIPLMDKQETERYSVQAALRAAMRESFEEKIGKLMFSVGIYQKLIRATIPIVASRQNKFYVLLSFDIGSESNSIIVNKIMPEIEKNKDYFL